MKKIIIASALLLSSTAAFALEIQQTPRPVSHDGILKVQQKKRAVTLNPATYVIINSTPEGELLKDLSWNSDGCAPDGMGGIAWVQVSGFAPQIVVNGNKMYIHAPITQLSDIAMAWIEGTISADGKKVTFPTPQAYMLNGFDILYATRCRPDGTPDPDNLNLVFDYVDGTLIQSDGGVLLLTNLEGGFYGYGEKSIVVEKIQDSVVEKPADVIPSTYLLSYTKAGNANRQTALVGFDGDDVYFSDPLGIENSWFKGVREGNRIVVSTPQYMGSESGFPMYVTTGSEFTTTQVDQFTGQPYEVTDYKVTPNADIIFTVDEATGTISSDQLLLMNSAKDKRGNAFAAANRPSYSPWEATYVVPADPVVTMYFDLNDYAEYGLSGCMVSFTIPSVGVDGDFIPQENLYYQISFDGKPLEFYDTTMIPYYGQFTDNATMQSITLSADNYDDHNMQVPVNPKKTISLQSFYDFYGEVIPSRKMDFEIVNGQLVDSGVDGVNAESEAVSVRYFNINGIEIEPAEGCGIVIRRTVNADGSQKCEKIIY